MPISKLLASLAAVGSCVSTVSAKQPSARTDFSGRWALNVTETNHLPEGLKAYIMIVSQGTHQFEVGTNVKGKLTPRIPQLPFLSGAKIGFLSALHTWGHNLQHPRVRRAIPTGDNPNRRSRFTPERREPS